MTELPYRSEHVNDSIADTDELTNEELGAYVRLQRAFWRAGGYLPASDLARFARAGRRWAMIAPRLLRKLTIVDGTASCSQILELLLRTRERRARAVERATKGGYAAAAKRSVAQKATTSVVSLNGANPLKTNEPILLEAAVKQSYKRANQNLNSESKSLSLSVAATGGRDIYAIGIKLLVDRVGIRSLAARSQIARWIGATSENEVDEMLSAATHENLRGSHFVSVIDQRIRSVQIAKERGLSLPFGPQIVGKQ